jgi:hypothetical protein
VRGALVDRAGVVDVTAALSRLGWDLLDDPPAREYTAPLLGKISPITFSMTRLLQNATFDASPSFFAVSQLTYCVLAVRPSACLESAR